MDEPEGPQRGRDLRPETATPPSWAPPGSAPLSPAPLSPAPLSWAVPGWEMPASAGALGSHLSVGADPVQPDRGEASSSASSSFALLISAFCCLALLVAAAWLPSGYVIMGPGQVSDTLGSSSGQPLITIAGHESYPTTGSLDMTSVSVWGGPGVRIGLLDLLSAWFKGEDVVLPEAQLFPASETAAQADQQSKQEMVDSQSAATAAALDALGISVPMELKITEVAKGVPAHELLKVDDVLVSVNGVDATTIRGYHNLLPGVEAGQTVPVVVLRSGVRQTLQIKTAKNDSGKAMLGVYLEVTVKPPFTVTIHLNDVGGPSAGTMFALGIYDKLTPGSLTGGVHIAGTGTMSLDGLVGPIGGIRQKMIGARRAGADWFLAPADNCDEVAGHVPGGLRVVRIATLKDAIAAVKAIGTKSATSLPTCSG